MTTVPQRHTYYGGSTAAYTSPRPALNYKPKRKQVTFGPYIVGSTLGEGEFGKVKLGWSKVPAQTTEVPKQVAIKLVRRDSIPKNSEKEVKIYREINALKHLNHPNIVRLEEVLQNSKYIGIVLEYASGGEFYKYIQKKRRLKEPAACRLFAQLISGVQYMHSKGLVHRDLKLENLLLDKHENLLITDFGFVNEFSPKSELMKTSCGSPCYAAPELVLTTKPYEARKADVWSCGVIMYAMLAGYLPWDDDPDNPDGDDIAKLYRYITRTSLKFPEYIAPVPRDLLRRILVSDPKKRLSVKQIEQHRWLQPHAPFLSVTPEEWDKVVQNKQIFRPPPSKAGNQNSDRPRSNCSTSSTNSKGEKRNSLIMDSSLYSQPVPPQESQSHAIATQSSPSSELRQSPVKRFNRHSRSNSAASIALQAVVDAERDYHAHHSPLPVPASTSFQYDHQSQNASGSSPRMQTFSAPKAVNSAISSLRDTIIIETSPQKGAVMVQSQRDSTIVLTAPLTISPGSSPVNGGFKSQLVNISSANHQTTHNLGHHRRPRPTSYHPTSYATFTETNNSHTTISGVVSPAESPPSGEKIISPDPSSTKKGSPQVVKRGSFSLSMPSVDLQIVAGDLIKSDEHGDTVTKKIHDQVEDANNRSETTRSRRLSQRYSVAYDNLFGVVAEESEESAIQETDRQAGEQKLGGVTDTKKNNSPVEKREKKRFSLLSFYSSYNASKSSIESGTMKDAPARNVSGSTDSRQASNSIQKTDSQGNSQNDHRNVSVSSPIQKADSQTRSQTQIRNTSAGQKPASRASSQSKSEARTASQSSRGSAGVQRHSSVTGRKSNKPPTETNKRNNRASVMVSSLQDQNQPQLRAREQSTAKKVLDFFKRRSMRL